MLVFELSMSPGLVPCPTEGQLFKSRYFGGYTCQVWRTGQKITGGAFVEGGRALLRLSALWQLETWKDFISVQLQVVGKQ